MDTLETKKFKWHPGYGVVIGLVFFYALIGGLTCNLNGLFFTPVMEEFGCTRAQASMYLTIFFISAAVSEPLAGITLNKFDNRWFFPVIDLVYCLGYIWTAYAKSLVVFNIFGVIYGVTAAHFMYMGGPVILARWFKKGTATAWGVVSVILSLVQMVGSPLIQGIISNQGWRQARLVGGLICLVLSVPLTIIFIRHSPEKVGVKAIGDGAAPVEDEKKTVKDVVQSLYIPFKRAIKSPAFYMNCLLVAALATAATVMQFISSFGSATSIGATVAAFGLSILSGASIAYKFVWGVLADLLGSVKVIVIAALAGVIGLLLMLYSGAGEVPKIGLFYASCALFSAAYSSLGVLAPMFTKAAWGVKDYSKIYSYCTMVLFFMNAIGNYIYAALSDNGGFTASFSFAIVLYVLIAIMAPVISKMCKKIMTEEGIPE